MISNSAIRGFDFHSHIDLHPDPSALITRCEQERVVVLAVTTTPRAWPQNRLWMKNSSYVFAAVGLHPELVADRYSEIDLLEQYIRESRLVGEVGLDGSMQYRGSYEQQKEVFARVLAASNLTGGRVLTIHSRRAARDTVSLIKNHTDPARVLCILHWFSGSLTDARRAVDVGCYFSVNASMLSHESGRKLVRFIPDDRLLTETDSPFTNIDGRKSGPLDSIRLVGELSGLLSEDVRMTEKRIGENARRVFQFAGFELKNSI